MTGPGYLAAGTLLRGRYEIVREIGRGGYSVVYLARDRELDGEVALKLLVPPPAAAHVARERMRPCSSGATWLARSRPLTGAASSTGT